ncbi:hypothetical protein [Paraburkholderia strydomiana]|uniref:hypothetical protein n=1 Tax=Paraburkholderia strydomiana TaxID=1245417 RepID=UPI0038BBD496
MDIEKIAKAIEVDAGEHIVTIAVSTRVEVSKRVVRAVNGEPQGEYGSLESEAATREALGADVAAPEAVEHARQLIDDIQPDMPPEAERVILAASLISGGADELRTELDYRAALQAVSALVDTDPKPGTPDGDRLERLAAQIECYEAEHFPLGQPGAD